MKTPQERKIEKLKEIIKDSFYQTGYSNGKLKYELSLIDKEIEEEKDVEETEQYCYKCSNYNNDDICKKCDDSFCMFKEIEQGEEKGLPKNSERDWTEDFPHENGMYQNRCMDCGLLFFGHKRRVWCKLCGGKPAKADSDKRKRAEETEKGIIEFMLTDLFNDLQKNAYNFEYHNYHYKEANQIIRKHWEQYHKEQSVTDNDIKSWAKSQFLPDVNKYSGHAIAKSYVIDGIIVGAKAMRDGKIGK